MTSCGAGAGSQTSTTPASPRATGSPNYKPAVCRLPVSLGAVSGGWLEYPGGRFIEDPNAGSLVDPGSGVLKTKAQPALFGAIQTRGFTYSSSLKRWLPAQFPLVSADGTAYVWTDFQQDKRATYTVDGHTVSWELQKIHLVQAKSGQDRVLTQDNLYSAVALTATAVYVTKSLYGGLARLDLETGQVQPLVPEGKTSWLIGGGYAWATDNGHQRPFDTVYRANLVSGTMEPFFSQAGAVGVFVMGIDAGGSPLVEVQRISASGESFRQLWVASAQGSNLVTDRPPLLNGTWITDVEGVWVGGDQGVYLWKGSQLTPVIEFGDTKVTVPAGTCAS